MEITNEEKFDGTKSCDLPDHSVPSPAEQNDCSTFGQSLIKFMTLATGSVKTALQKPANYKKNINHRRYLQKQLKICTRKKRRGVKTKNVGPHTKKKFPENQRMMRTREVYLSQAGCVPLLCHTTRPENSISDQYYPKQDVMSYDASYPSSILSTYQGYPSNVMKQGGYIVPPIGHDMVTATTLQEGYRDEILPDVFEETGHFMSGEELTQTLDIKDLFVPERTFENVTNIGSIDDQLHSYSTNNFDVSHHNGGFQTIPSTANILSW